MHLCVVLIGVAGLCLSRGAASTTLMSSNLNENSPQEAKSFARIIFFFLSFLIFATIVLSSSAAQLLIGDHLAVTEPFPLEDIYTPRHTRAQIVPIFFFSSLLYLNPVFHLAFLLITGWISPLCLTWAVTTRSPPLSTCRSDVFLIRILPPSRFSALG